MSCCSSTKLVPQSVVRKGAWTLAEDSLLRRCIQKHGLVKWSCVPQLAGLNRCRKSCRLRWLNYLDPDIKRGTFEEDEVDLIIRLHKLLGNRWSLIAGRIPGRTANDIKNYWTSHLREKVLNIVEYEKDGGHAIVATRFRKPQPLTYQTNSNKEKGYGKLQDENNDVNKLVTQSAGREVILESNDVECHADRKDVPQTNYFLDYYVTFGDGVWSLDGI